MTGSTIKELIRRRFYDSDLFRLIILRNISRDIKLWTIDGVFCLAFIYLEEGFLTELLDRIVEIGADLNYDSQDKWPSTLIDAAATSGKLKTVKMLWKNGAVLIVDTLPYAIASGNEDLIRYLIFDLQADLNSIDHHKTTPYKITPLAAAIKLQKP